MKKCHMRIGIAVDYGKIPNATSLDVVGKELFKELKPENFVY